MVLEVSTLHSLGAQHILLPNLSDLGSTPEVLALGATDAAIATQASIAFDTVLASSLPRYVTQFNVFAAESLIIQNAAAYGFTDLADACLINTTLCTTPNNYVYWDSLHPTTAVNQLLANSFATAAVPLPSTFTLMLAGLGLIVGAARKRLF